MRTLSTDRLLLRPLERRDLRALHTLYGDPDVMRFIIGRGRTPWETARRLRKDIRHHRTHGFGLVLGLDRTTGDVVGRFGFEPVLQNDRIEGELAWMVAPSHQGQGFATEAGAALVAFGLDELALPRLFACADRQNGASIRIMEKLGMRPCPSKNDDVVYEILGRGQALAT